MAEQEREPMRLDAVRAVLDLLDMAGAANRSGNLDAVASAAAAAYRRAKLAGAPNGLLGAIMAVEGASYEPDEDDEIPTCERCGEACPACEHEIRDARRRGNKQRPNPAREIADAVTVALGELARTERALYRPLKLGAA